MTTWLVVVDPATSYHVAVRPVLMLFVCACKIHPIWLAGHESVSWLPEMLVTILVGVAVHRIDDHQCVGRAAVIIRRPPLCQYHFVTAGVGRRVRRAVVSEGHRQSRRHGCGRGALGCAVINLAQGAQRDGCERPAHHNIAQGSADTPFVNRRRKAGVHPHCSDASDAAQTRGDREVRSRRLPGGRIGIEGDVRDRTAGAVIQPHHIKIGGGVGLRGGADSQFCSRPNYNP